MQTIIKKSLLATMMALMLCAVALTGKAWAAQDPSALLDLQNSGNGTVSVTVKDYDKLDDLTTLELVLDVAANQGDVSYLQAAFAFNNTINAPVKTYTSEVVDGVLRVHIYISGSEEPIFPEDASAEGVYLGTLDLALSDTAPAGTTLNASVSIPEGLSAFKGVTTEYIEVTMPDANLSVQTLNDIVVDETVANSITQPISTDSQNAKNTNTASDTVGKTPETNPNNVQVGDNTMPLIIGLICVVVIAAIVIVVVVAKRRKSPQESEQSDDSAPKSSE